MVRVDMIEICQTSDPVARAELPMRHAEENSGRLALRLGNLSPFSFMNVGSYKVSEVSRMNKRSDNIHVANGQSPPGSGLLSSGPIKVPGLVLFSYERDNVHRTY